MAWQNSWKIPYKCHGLANLQWWLLCQWHCRGMVAPWVKWQFEDEKSRVPSYLVYWYYHLECKTEIFTTLLKTFLLSLDALLPSVCNAYVLSLHIWWVGHRQVKRFIPQFFLLFLLLAAQTSSSSSLQTLILTRPSIYKMMAVMHTLLYSPFAITEPTFSVFISLNTAIRSSRAFLECLFLSLSLSLFSNAVTHLLINPTTQSPSVTSLCKMLFCPDF